MSHHGPNPNQPPLGVSKQENTIVKQNARKIGVRAHRQELDDYEVAEAVKAFGSHLITFEMLEGLAAVTRAKTGANAHRLIPQIYSADRSVSH